MTPIQREFQFLSAGFPHGAYQSQNHNRPELRSPSVRGQIRWWYDALFDQQSAGEIFGKVKPEIQASKIVIRVETLQSDTFPTPFIPHKGRQGGRKDAFEPGSRFSLRVSDRREGLSREQGEKLGKAIEAWLLMGAIGQRGNRAAGSIWPVAHDRLTIETYTSICKKLLTGSKLTFAVLKRTFESELQIRHVAGDFLADQAFISCGTPFGSARPRKPSNLKLKMVQLDGELKLLALWDGRRQAVADLKLGIKKLAETKEIGELLADAQQQFGT